MFKVPWPFLKSVFAHFYSPSINILAAFYVFRPALLPVAKHKIRLTQPLRFLPQLLHSSFTINYRKSVLCHTCSVYHHPINRTSLPLRTFYFDFLLSQVTLHIALYLPHIVEVTSLHTHKKQGQYAGSYT